MNALGVGTLLILNIVTVKLTLTKLDLPCAARPIYNRSVVCVCNMTYCDEITRDEPKPGTFITYTSSEGGSRFKKGLGFLHTINLSHSPGMLTFILNPEKRYQTVRGFGGAITDSVGILWRSLPDRLQQYLLDSYFSDRGIEYNLLRVPIGASDFSVRRYSLDDYPGDESLEHFSLQYEDYEYKIPMIKEIMRVSNTKIDVIGSSWSSPRWMKETIPQNPVCGFLKYQYFQTFADYLRKFVESYEAEGVPIWALTTGNEPTTANWPVIISSCLGWATDDLGYWIVNNLGPTIRNSEQRNLTLLAMDDQRFTIKTVFEPMVWNNPGVLNYIDGVAVHFYADAYVSAEVLASVWESYSKFVISTEASAGFRPTDKKVDLGSWARAQTYVRDIIENLSNNVIGWVDWNICLNTEGGPNVDSNFVDSPVIIDAENGEFLKQPMFYALGHFSKFIPRGSRRIDLEASQCNDGIYNVAFLTPYNTIIVVIYNRGTSRPISLQLGISEVVISLEQESVTTVEFQNE